MRVVGTLHRPNRMLETTELQRTKRTSILWFGGRRDGAVLGALLGDAPFSGNGERDVADSAADCAVFRFGERGAAFRRDDEELTQACVRRPNHGISI